MSFKRMNPIESGIRKGLSRVASNIITSTYYAVRRKVRAQTDQKKYVQVSGHAKREKR